MPEKTSTSASFTLHYEQEKLAQLSEDATCESSYCDECEEMEDEEIGEDDYESDFDDDNIPDLGDILGFRITGGTDFCMPITIFHVISHFFFCLLPTQSFEKCIDFNKFKWIFIWTGKGEQSSWKGGFETRWCDLINQWQKHWGYDFGAGKQKAREGSRCWCDAWNSKVMNQCIVMLIFQGWSTFDFFLNLSFNYFLV